ncbi:hypothetical protein [Marixanthotalea marina]|nr:hypothetical protein [Marixanthotalea marina]
MFTSEQIPTFAYESEYETAYDLSQKGISHSLLITLCLFLS